MKTIKTHAFTFEGVDYEVRAWVEPNGIRVQAFTNNAPANAFSYSVSWEMAFDFADHSADLADELIKTAENHVRLGFGLPHE